MHRWLVSLTSKTQEHRIAAERVLFNVLQIHTLVSARQAPPVYRPYRLQIRAGESQRSPSVTKKWSTGPPFLPPVSPKVLILSPFRLLDRFFDLLI